MNHLIKIILTVILFFPHGKKDLRAAIDLYKLKKAGTLINGPDKSFPVGPQWSDFLEGTRGFELFKETLRDMSWSLCSSDLNRSVLLVGDDPYLAKFIFAKFSQNKLELCRGITHFSINLNKVIAGHSYVGDVEKYWEEIHSILKRVE